VVGEEVEGDGLTLTLEACNVVGVLLRAAPLRLELSAGRRREEERSEEPARAVKNDLVLLAPIAAGCD
jgi:hypothetical protein